MMKYYANLDWLKLLLFQGIFDFLCFVLFVCFCHSPLDLVIKYNMKLNIAKKNSALNSHRITGFMSLLQSLMEKKKSKKLGHV